MKPDSSEWYPLTRQEEMCTNWNTENST